MMDELLARHFSEAAYFGVHRLFVDTYCLQHPDRYCASFKSLAAHLSHLCWSLEHGGSRAIPSEALRRWVERHPGLTKPALPDFRGTLTISHVARAPDVAAHSLAVDEWARSTWDAYSALHSTARHWVELALAGESRTGGRSAARVERPGRKRSTEW
jgi:hypothetical protein